MARSIIAASRWQPLPVLTCTARAPVARIRSASFEVCWSPSITASGCAPSAAMVRQSSVVLPEPGDDTRFTASTRRSASARRLRAAMASFFDRMPVSISISRAWLIPATSVPAGPRPRWKSW